MPTLYKRDHQSGLPRVHHIVLTGSAASSDAAGTLSRHVISRLHVPSRGTTTVRPYGVTLGALGDNFTFNRAGHRNIKYFRAVPR